MARKKTVVEEPAVPVEETAALETAESTEAIVPQTEPVPAEDAAAQESAPEQEGLESDPAVKAASDADLSEEAPVVCDEPQTPPQPHEPSPIPLKEPEAEDVTPAGEQLDESEEAPPGLPPDTDETSAPIPEDVPSVPAPDEVGASEAAGPAPLQETPVSGETDPTAGNEKEAEAARPASFFDLNYNVLDRNLSPEERQEWNSIYASYRSRSILTGAIIGVDEHTFAIRNRDTGVTERKTVQCAIVISYRVKVLIPETDLWFSPAEARPGFVLRNMVGATVDYVILQVDREGGVAIGSRRMAMGARRYQLSRLTGLHRPDALTKCRLLSVGPRRCLVECHGYDVGLTQRDMRYTAIPDMRTEYHPGQELDCRIKHYDPEKGELRISVKEVHPHPFEGAQLRHPIGSRRQAVIAGKYAGGVFCNLPDGTVCMSLYSARHDDADFKVGDNVIIVIRQYDNAKKQIYGKIVSKW